MIHDQFLKQKTFKLADSPETADFIFFVQGEYFYLDEKCNSGGCSRDARLTTGEKGLELNALARLRVATFSKSDFLEWQNNVPRLLETAKWREDLWGKFRLSDAYQAPSAQEIVKGFHSQTLLKK